MNARSNGGATVANHLSPPPIHVLQLSLFFFSLSLFAHLFTSSISTAMVACLCLYSLNSCSQSMCWRTLISVCVVFRSFFLCVVCCIDAFLAFVSSSKHFRTWLIPIMTNFTWSNTSHHMFRNKNVVLILISQLLLRWSVGKMNDSVVVSNNCNDEFPTTKM